MLSLYKSKHYRTWADNYLLQLEQIGKKPMEVPVMSLEKLNNKLRELFF